MTDTTTAGYRPIGPFHGACTTCNEVHPLTDRHKQPAVRNKYGITHKRFLLPVHGTNGDRCPGSHTEPQPWLIATGLPTWDDMTDADRGAALMFAWKVQWERNYAYARENYPARYIDHPLLTALTESEACRHASAVAGTWDEAKGRLGADAVQRLYDLASNR